MTIYGGDTFRISNTLTDYDDTPLTPDSQTVTLFKPDGSAGGSVGTPTVESAGVYYVDVTPDVLGPAGTWKLMWTITKGSKDRTDVIEFQVLVRP